MSFYYVNKVAKANGDHEVHKSTCISLPPPEQRLALGYHESSVAAVEYAKLNFRQSNGCSSCALSGYTP